MSLENILTIGLGLLISIISYVWKKETDGIKADNDELRNMIKDREDRNYSAHKEVWQEMGNMRERMTKVETTQERCQTCRGE